MKHVPGPIVNLSAPCTVCGRRLSITYLLARLDLEGCDGPPQKPVALPEKLW